MKQLASATLTLGRFRTTRLPLLAALLLAALPTLAPAQMTIEEHVLALKASIAASKTILRSYQWMETTVVKQDDEEKSRSINRCYYGLDGVLQKVPVETPQPEERRRLFGRMIAEHRKEEREKFVADATALMQLYFPPDAMRIQIAKDAGRIALSPINSQRASITIAGYYRPNDSFSLQVDTVNNRPLTAKVSTSLDADDRPVTLEVTFGLLENNANYPKEIVLKSKDQDIVVTVTNSGYLRQQQ